MKKLSKTIIQTWCLICLLMIGAATAAQAATFTVNLTTDDGDGVCDASCTLRDAILSANAQADDDVIEFDQTVFAGTKTITLGGSELSIANNGSLTINGSGAKSLTVSGNNASRVFYINSGAKATINGLTATKGNGSGASPDTCGGAILVSFGSLTLNSSAVSGNSVPHGGFCNSGSGIVNYFGTLNINNSIIDNNQGAASVDTRASSATGAITNIFNSTISNNVGKFGGGLTTNNGTYNLINVTISNNTGNYGAGIRINGGIYNVKNTIIANSNGLDCNSGGTLNIQNSLVEDGSCGVTSGVNNNLTGDPNLGSLADNGGPTQTHALLPNSAAIDAGSDTLAVDANGNALTTDQRGAGFARKVGSAVDIGAFEFSSLVVTNTNNDGTGSLRAAVEAANTDTAYDAITFDIPASDTGCTNGVCTIKLTSGELSIASNSNLLINGTGANRLAISGNNSSRVFNVAGGANLTLNGVTVKEGTVITNENFERPKGGGIFNSGTLTITNSALSGNSLGLDYLYTFGEGGGIYNNFGSVTIVNSVVSGNALKGSGDCYGGGIYNNFGTVTIDGGTVSSNTACINASSTSLSSAGAIYNKGALILKNSGFHNNSSPNSGGAILNESGTMTAENCTFSQNSSRDGFGGAINHRGNSASITATIINSTFSGNSAYSGGAIANDFSNSRMLIRNATFSGNIGTNQSAKSAIIVVAYGGTADIQVSNTIFNNSGTNTPNFRLSNGATITSLGNNLSSDAADGDATTAPGGVLNQTGDIRNTNARLAPLGNYGGTTMTHALLSNSPAINAGTSTNAPATDQRGASKVGAVDIGAFELNNSTNGGTFKAVLPDGRQGAAYSFTLVPNNVHNGTTFSYTAGTLPNGLELRTTNNTVSLSGTPTENGTFDFSVTASDGTNTVVTDYSLEILPPLDSTPPVITPTVSGTLGAGGWYTSDVQVSWNVVDEESTVSDQSGCGAQSVTTDTTGVTFTCSAMSAGGSDSQSVTVKRDATIPTYTLTSRTEANQNGWNNTNVTLKWDCTDATSGVLGYTSESVLSGEGANRSKTVTCADKAGNAASDTQSGINIDKTAPMLAPTVSPNPVLLNGAASASPNASDTLSGIASASCDAVNTSSVGFKSVNCTATDLAGNTTSAPAAYQVVYSFAGFFSPVANLPAINQANAGQAIPVKFSLSGNKGLNILAAGYPVSAPIACETGDAGSTIDETVSAGSSTLSYDAASDTYSYVWKTDKKWKGTCRLLTVKLNDGSEYSAKFRFK